MKTRDELLANLESMIGVVEAYLFPSDPESLGSLEEARVSILRAAQRVQGLQMLAAADKAARRAMNVEWVSVCEVGSI